jgi:hypothetical protein
MISGGGVRCLRFPKCGTPRSHRQRISDGKSSAQPNKTLFGSRPLPPTAVVLRYVSSPSQTQINLRSATVQTPQACTSTALKRPCP